jgi:hypothetical protein
MFDEGTTNEFNPHQTLTRHKSTTDFEKAKSSSQNFATTISHSLNLTNTFNSTKKLVSIHNVTTMLKENTQSRLE